MSDRSVSVVALFSLRSGFTSYNLIDTGIVMDRPHVHCEKYHAVLRVANVRSTVEFYTERLGFWLAFTEGDPPTFAGVNLGAVQLFLERGTPGPQGCALYFVIDDADALQRFHMSSGVEVVEPIGDRPYGLRDYTVRDPSGYQLTFGHHPQHCADHTEARAT